MKPETEAREAEARAQDFKAKASEVVRDKKDPRETRLRQLDFKAQAAQAEAQAAQLRADAAKARSDIIRDEATSARSQAYDPTVPGSLSRQTQYYDALWLNQVQEKADQVYRKAQVEADKKMKVSTESHAQT